MPEFNVLNLPQIHQQAQAAKMNQFNLDRGQVQAQRQDQQYEQDQELNNIKQLYGATSVVLDLFEQAPDQVPYAVDELGRYGVEAGWLDPTEFEQIKQDGVTREEMMQLNNSAKIALAQRPGFGARTQENPTSPQRNYAERQRLVQEYGENSPQVQTFDSYVRAPKIYDAAGVPTKDTPGGQVPLSTQRAELDYVANEAQAKAQGARAGQPIDLTPAELEVDKKFAADYNEFMLGGFADAEKGLAQLAEVSQQLQSGQHNLTGWRVAATPDWVKVVTDPEALNARDQVEEVVQRNLRVILGAQFTEEEGKRLIARAYNPALEERYNIARLNRLMKSMADSVAAKQSAANYYQANGTLKGWTGDPQTVAAPSQAVDSMIKQMDQTSGALVAAQKAIAQGANREQVIQRLMQMGIDPSGL